MCFSETQSYINFVVLLITSIICLPYWRLCFPLVFLALKELLQGLLYRNIDNKKVNNTLTKLSWIHICFQPLIVNIFLSQFSTNYYVYWNVIFVLCIIYGIYTITTLKDYKIRDNDDCVKINNKNDFCSNNTLSYIGKYHVGYGFKRNSQLYIFPMLYTGLMFLPYMFTQSRLYGMLWSSFVFTTWVIGEYFNLKYGETAAIWCFLSIIYMVPISVIYKLRN